MDSTFDGRSPEIIQIRQNIYQPTKIAPVLRLVAVNTIEHILLCVSSTAENRLYLCLEAMKALRDVAGILDPVYEAAIGNTSCKIGEWIGRKCEGVLKIPALPELPLFEAVAPTQTQPTFEDVQVESSDNSEKSKRQVDFFLFFKTE
jgi:hypothetical protein